jgi:tRNA(fMet)-specific endonuclease VapC
MRYLLDSNVFIAWLVRGDRRVMRKMEAHYGQYGISSIVLFELYFGAFNSARLEQNLVVIDELGLSVLDFAAEDARAAGEVRATLKKRGTPVGPYDLLIAGQALARNLILVTANRREFARIEGLKLQDWTAANG